MTVLDSAWQSAEDMSTPRADHVSAVVGGRWVVGGGGDGTPNFLATTEAFDPGSGHWQALGALMVGRTMMAAAVDALGSRVLFAGGSPPGSVLFVASNEADIGDGSTWSASSLLTARYGLAAAFAAGAFVVSGGYGTDRQLADAEMLDATMSTWTAAGTMPGGARAFHTMTTLADGHSVLVAGGSQGGMPIATADILDATTQTWQATGSMNTPRSGHSALLLGDGRVLVVGGLSPQVQPSAEIYDPASRSWSQAASMRVARYHHAAVLLPGGRVLVAGGSGDGPHEAQGALDSVEVYDPIADSWIPGPSLQVPRVELQAAVLAQGVLVAGGTNQDMPALASTERLAFVVMTVGGDSLPEGGVQGEPEAGGQTRQGATNQSPGCACQMGAGSARPPETELGWLLALGAAMARRISRQSSRGCAVPSCGSETAARRRRPEPRPHDVREHQRTDGAHRREEQARRLDSLRVETEEASH